MLANPIDRAELDTLDPAHFRAEWKWDGIRVQVASSGGVKRLYSRAGEDVSGAFPDIVEAIDFDGVFDGELLVRREEAVAPFNDLQQRLNRKTVTPKMLKEHPAHVRLYDALWLEGEDLRALSFDQRRARLEAWMAQKPRQRFDLSPLVQLHRLGPSRRAARGDAQRRHRGLMLKRGDSAYLAGRPKGPWFKWKRDPMLADCVLMYAQRGHGKRSSFYSDFTFGCWREARRQARAGAGRQGLFRLHRRGAALARQMGARPHDQPLRPGARGLARAGAGDRLRRHRPLDPPQIGRRHALPAHQSHKD